MRLGPVSLAASVLILLAIPSTTVLAEGQRCRLRARRQLGRGSGDQVVFNSPTSNESGPTETSEASTTPSSSTAIGQVPSATTLNSPLPPFEYGTDTIRAVNLGGWLVLEPWITPSLFERTNSTDVIDERTLGSLVDRDTALEMLTQHWETWITEDDFIAIRAAGLTHVRIPLGYWSVPITSDDTSTSVSRSPFIPGAWRYLLRGLNWARKHGVRVIVDIHGAPGSQNGYDNSGQLTSNPRWALQPDFVTHTVDIVRFIAANVGGLVDVLELLNEPAGFRGSDWEAVIKQFYLEGHDAVREAAGDSLHVMISDAFLGVNSWGNFLTPPRGDGVLMDFHEYQIFSHLELDRTRQEHIDHACGYVQSLSAFASSNIWTVVGEWSNAITDCARWLNGRGVGARWDGTYHNDDRYHDSCEAYTGSYVNFSDSYKAFLRRYWEVQIEIGESVQGWIFWTWKAENADEWSYQRGLEGGWIPQDPTNRMYPNICSDG